MNKTSKTADDTATQPQRLTDLQNRLDALTVRVGSELEASKMRYDAILQSTERTFSFLVWFGAIGSFVGGIFVVVSWATSWRRSREMDHKQREDYKREREFYEERARNSEQRQTQLHEDSLSLSRTQETRQQQNHQFTLDLLKQIEARQSHAQEVSLEVLKRFDARQAEHQQATIELLRTTSSREGQFAVQQLALGDKFLSKSDDILAKQIDSIVKLGGVIDLVKQTFDMQLKREEKQEKLTDRFTETDEVVRSFTKHFEQQYAHVWETMLTFREHSRMAWTRLSPQEEALANSALTVFKTIPGTILENESKKSRYDAAWMLQLLGVAAFYTNDVDAAVRCLEASHKYYGDEDAPDEHLYRQAFCSHFLGLIEKNWCHRDRPIEANLLAAKRHLEEAKRRLSSRKGEFLTPLTYAEVLSYSEHERDAARTLLDQQLEQLTALKESTDGLDENQNALFGRALLMRGNLDYLDKQLDKAFSFYQRAHEHDNQNPYAQLSMAQSIGTEDPEHKMEQFRIGLDALANSDALKKRENSVRLTGLAWAVIASHETQDKTREILYWRDFCRVGADIRPVGNRDPLFFSPITKGLVTWRELRLSFEKLLGIATKAKGMG